jgi:hypothetical protein
MHTTIRFCDDVPTVHAGGQAAIETKLRRYITTR